MAKLNLDPITTFPDGSQLVVSTKHAGEGLFTCDLFVATSDSQGRLDLTVVWDHLEASTCLEAQEAAYRSAQRLYPKTMEDLKKPPYLIWGGPDPYR